MVHSYDVDMSQISLSSLLFSFDTWPVLPEDYTLYFTDFWHFCPILIYFAEYLERNIIPCAVCVPKAE